MRIHFWNFAFSLFFAVLVIWGSVWLVDTGKALGGITFGNLLILALAIFRLIRLFTYDHITQFVRDWFKDKPDTTFLGTVGSLINCPWCTGLWFSFIVVFFAYATPLAWPIILILALAALASFFQIVANWVGWNAEGKKQQVLKENSGQTFSCK